MSNLYLDSRGWPIVDRLLVAYLAERVTLPGVSVAWGTVFGEDRPAGRVQRLPGGGVNVDGYQDLSLIEIVTLGLDRPQSDDMTAQVRQAMADLSDDEYADVGIDTIRETAGPGRVPDPDPDVRAVPTTWAVPARRQ